MFSKDLIDETSWGQGPIFLRDSNLLWSTAADEKVEAKLRKNTKSSETETKAEVITKVTHVSNLHRWKILDKDSNLGKLLRVL